MGAFTRSYCQLGVAAFTSTLQRDIEMSPTRILVDSLADAGLLNAQMGNAREIVSRLDAERFHVTMFALGAPDPRLLARANTRLVQLPQRRQTVRIISEFLWGKHCRECAAVGTDGIAMRLLVQQLQAGPEQFATRVWIAERSNSDRSRYSIFFTRYA
jgi:hypothetical protein